MNPDQIRAALTRKVGPLPVGAWLAVVALGVGVTAAIIRRRRAAAGLDPEPQPADAPTTDEGNPFPTGGFTVGGLNPGTGSGIPSSSLPSSTPEVRTNSDWETSAIRWAIAKGFTPTIAAGAIAKFIGGQTLTAQEGALVDAALAANGPPPENVPPPNVETTPTGPGSVPGEGGLDRDRVPTITEALKASQAAGDGGRSWWQSLTGEQQAGFRAQNPGITIPN